jgi:hypothetical protein
MPALTRWFIKTSFVCLAAGLIVGLVMALQPMLRLPIPAGLFPIYIHLLVFGWLTQLIFGVVFWMFPKYSREQPRGSEALGWLTYALLNLGLLLRAIAEPIDALQPGPISGWTLVVSALLQFLAGFAFAANSWPRVKEK